MRDCRLTRTKRGPAHGARVCFGSPCSAAHGALRVVAASSLRLRVAADTPAEYGRG